MKIIEIWTKVKSINVSFTGDSVIAVFGTEPCAQHCLSWLKANPAYVVGYSYRGWSC